MGTSVSIVISMYNANRYVVEIIDRLLFPSIVNNADSRKELILVDDASPLRKETKAVIDKYAKTLEQKLGHFQYIENDRNLGFAGSYNHGLKRANGKDVLICNDDLYFPRNSIDRLVDALESSDEAGIVGPVTNYAWTYQNTSLFRPLKDYSEREQERIEAFSTWLKNVMHGKKVDMKHGLMGFCLALRGDLLKEVQYFDERFKYGNFEDTDLNKKVFQTGKKAVLEASIFIEHGGIHGGRASVRQNLFKNVWYTIANAALCAHKWQDYAGTVPGLIRCLLEGMDIGTVTKDIIRTARENNISLAYEPS